MRLFFIVLSIAFSVFSLLYFNQTQSLLLWKLTILCTEYGHYFAIITLLLFLLWIFCWQEKKSLLSVSIGLALLLGTFVYLVPSLSLFYHSSQWQKDLQRNFPLLSDPPTMQLPIVSQLFLGPLKQKPIKPETFVYSETSQYKLSLDFYRAKATKPVPFLVVIHGGGWNGGDRDQLSELNQILAAKAFAVASITYRLAPAWKWPAPREDAWAAVAYLKAHAKELGLDASQWVVLGRSAGGQIAESMAYQNIDPSLKGCISFYAPADMNYAYKFAYEDDILHSPTLIRDYLGGDPQSAQAAYDSSSPIRFVSANAPPTLLIHGPKDTLVWVKQSERLLAVLQEKHIPSMLLEIPWAMHGFDFNIDGPGGQMSTYAVEYFLRFAFHLYP